MRELDAIARLYIVAVCLAAGAAVGALVGADHHGQLSGRTVWLLSLAIVASSRVIRINDRVHLGASHPFIFAALLIEGPVSAVLVGVVSILFSGLIKRTRMRPHQIVFNVAATTLCTSVGWVAYAATLGAAPAPTLVDLILPVTAASTVFFALSSGLVAVIVAITSSVSLSRAWYENAFWSGPSFLAGGTVGLVIARAIARFGVASLLLALPFCYLIYFSYRLYAERLQEKKRRIEVVERLNAELETKVKERTDELVHLNDKLVRSNEKLAEASRLKSAFLANMSHELRTPLNAILGFSEMLAEGTAGELTPRQKSFAQEIHSSGRDLLTLISEILDLSKIEAGKMRLQLEDCDPSVLVTQAVSMVRVLADNKGVKLVRDEDAPAGTIHADPVRVRQILWNLLSNAIKFTPSGGRVGVAVSGGPGRMVGITVWDTGIGIAEGERDKLFDEFYQVDGSHTRQHGGTGLGLALVQRFVAMHGGTIDVASTPGEGSRFVVTLPAGTTAGACSSGVFLAAVGDDATTESRRECA